MLNRNKTNTAQENNATDSFDNLPPDLMPRAFHSLSIPRDIWFHKELLLTEKCLWAEIHSLYNSEYGGCYASEAYLCQFMGVKRSHLYGMLKKLKDLGLMEDVSFDGRVKVRKAIEPKNVTSTSGQQQSGKPDGRRPVQRTAPIIYETKGYIKDRKEEQLSAAPPPPPDEKVIYSQDLTQAERDAGKGKLVIPLEKWNQFVKAEGQDLVLRVAESLSNAIAMTPGKYKNHHLALANWIKRQKVWDAERASKQFSGKPKESFRANYPGAGTYQGGRGEILE